MRLRILSLVLAAASVASPSARQQPVAEAPNPVRAAYTKFEHMVPMPGHWKAGPYSGGQGGESG